MTLSLRRSRRAPKKNSEYNAGDIVEINRNGVALKGRLAQLLTEGTSPNPRWLVKFDGQPQKDEEMYERSFGQMLSTYDEDAHSSSSSPVPVPSPAVAVAHRKPVKPQSGNNGSTRRGSGAGRISGMSSEGEAGSDSKFKINEKKAVQFEGSNAGSDSSALETSSRRDARVSAREARSQRRQAKIDEDEPIAEGELLAGGKRRALPPPKNSKKHKRGGEGEGEGEVVKVKLLTGTLYLYRGRHRRAEFIRRV